MNLNSIKWWLAANTRKSQKRIPHSRKKTRKRMSQRTMTTLVIRMTQTWERTISSRILIGFWKKRGIKNTRKGWTLSSIRKADSNLDLRIQTKRIKEFIKTVERQSEEEPNLSGLVGQNLRNPMISKRRVSQWLEWLDLQLQVEDPVLQNRE